METRVRSAYIYGAVLVIGVGVFFSDLLKVPIQVGWATGFLVAAFVDAIWSIDKVVDNRFRSGLIYGISSFIIVAAILAWNQTNSFPFMGVSPGWLGFGLAWIIPLILDYLREKLLEKPQTTRH